MKVSVCVTVLNEEDSIAQLLDGLLSQTQKPDEIVVVDGGSLDKTVEIIKHFQKKYKSIRLLVAKGPRSKGRNLGVEISRNRIVATVDAGTLPCQDWLEKITSPFKHPRVEIVAGFYNMVGHTNIQKAMSIFLGVTSKRFSRKFLPSTRSLAFTKNLWEKVGGFPEKETNTAEDTEFNYKVVKMGVKYFLVKDARVEWAMPLDLKAFFAKVESYAQWDVAYGILWHPVQGFMSHNIKAASVVLRYVLGVFLLFIFQDTLRFPLLVILLGFYVCWSFRKVFVEFNRADIAIYGPLIQITSDFAVMSGFLKGILGR